VDLTTQTGLTDSDVGLFWADESWAQYRSDLATASSAGELHVPTPSTASLQGLSFCSAGCTLSKTSGAMSDTNVAQTQWENTNWMICFASYDCRAIDASAVSKNNVTVPAGGRIIATGCKAGYKIDVNKRHQQYFCNSSGTLTKEPDDQIGGVLYDKCAAESS
jgi:hypothetical protein